MANYNGVFILEGLLLLTLEKNCAKLSLMIRVCPIKIFSKYPKLYDNPNYNFLSSRCDTLDPKRKGVSVSMERKFSSCLVGKK